MTYRMGKAIGTGMRICMPRIGMGRVCMPIIGNREAGRQAGDDVLRDLKSHIIGWYDVKRQGCTNDSLAENPVLEDLSGNNHPLELHNFTFDGLSGMGGYGTDLTKWTVTDSGAIINRTAHKATVNVSSAYTPDFRLEYKDEPVYFKAKVDVPGVFEVRSLVAATATVSADENGVFEIYSDYFSWIYFAPAERTTLQYTIEILPNFPDSLVFNGVTPEYVINRNNVVLLGTATAVGLNKFKYTAYGRVTRHFKGEAGQRLHILVPSLIVKVTGFQSNVETDKHLMINVLDNVNSVYVYHLTIRKDGTYNTPRMDYTIEPTDETFVPTAKVEFVTHNFVEDENCEIEILPNYPAPTTKMYGVIPSIRQGAKGMMMDFMPTFPIKHSDYITYYTQRQQQLGAKYALMFTNAYLKNIAYKPYNAYDTYINGLYNDKLRYLDLLNKRQVVSVNAEEVFEMPANRGIVIGSDETLTSRFPTMAFNSLILFDRELTEKEMKLVMNKLMKYEDRDNIAADFRRAREMTLAEADEPEETGGLEDFWEME
ncbi:MAG: hypothetical protein K2H16_06060 [Prevotella sp.]|nr:hypothetical protein [Prevotella sp.]